MTPDRPLPDLGPGLRAVELRAEDAPVLQPLLEACPAYFELVQGGVAAPDEARRWMASAAPPASMPFSRLWHVGAVDAGERLVAFASTVDDLLAPGVFHVGLFIVATDRHGTGLAQAFYAALEAWARAAGAQWMRLGVVVGNTRGERFWRRHGFVETRLREGMPMGTKVNTVRVLFKALAGGTRDEYLALVARDRPEPASA
jgi:GNAT superfamily N-acetyltransferase